MNTLLSLRVFCAVADYRSFSAAADRLELSAAMASKHVQHLEQRIGARLLNRTSRSVSLTEAGQLYFSEVKVLLEGLDEVEATVGNASVKPRGTLRMSAPVWVANPLFTSVLAQYSRRYPEVSLDLDLSGQIVNLAEEGIDLALRAMPSAKLDVGLVARPLIKVPFQLVAAPSYLAGKKMARTLADLNGHDLLMYSAMNPSGSLMLEGRRGTVPVKFRPVLRSENETMLHLAALAGMGMVFLPAWMTQADIQSGALQMILGDEVVFQSTLHAVYPSKKYLTAKVRTFIDFFDSQSHLFPGLSS